MSRLRQSRVLMMVVRLREKRLVRNQETISEWEV